MDTLRSYTPLATVSLPQASVLHPDACNPQMDIVALLSATSTKGAQAQGQTVTLWRLNGGPKVWSKDLGGSVEAMNWSPDGLNLALLVRHSEGAGNFTLDVYSVHDGDLLQSVNRPTGAFALASAEGEDSWAGRQIDWTWTEQPDPVQFGSALSVISTLPHLQPLEVAQAPSTHSFLPLSIPGASSSTFKPTPPTCLSPSLPRLANSLLPPLTPDPPRASLLNLTLPETQHTFPFLSGTYPLPSSLIPPKLSLRQPNPPTKEVHAFTQIATAVEELLRYLATGIDNLREGWVGKTGSGTMTKEWVKSIGDALRQHGEAGDVRLALGELLMTGRPGEGLTNFLGGKLTPRTLGRWESTVLSALTSIRQTCYAELVPATERVLLLLKELHGWSLWPQKYSAHLNLHADDISKSISGTTLLLRHLIKLEQLARDEHHRFTHFCFWLAYEIATAAANASLDSDEDPLLDGKHNVLLVADYIHCGLETSAIDPYFSSIASLPDRPESNLTENVVQSEEEAEKSLAASMSHLSTLLQTPSSTAMSRTRSSQSSGLQIPKSPSILKSPILNRSSRSPNVSRARLSSPTKPFDQSRRTEGEASMSMSISMDMSNSMSMDRVDSSEEDGTMSMDFGGRQVVDSVIADVEEEEEGRPLASPVYSLPDVVDTVVGSVRSIVEGALVGRPPQPGQSGSDGETFGTLQRWKTTGDKSQLAFIASGPQPSLQLFKRNEEALLGASFELRLEISNRDVEVLDMGFFTSDEFVLVLCEDQGGDERFLLASINLTSVCFQSARAVSSSEPVDLLMSQFVESQREATAPYLPICRLRQLTSLDGLPRAPRAVGEPPSPPPVRLALNGNKGRMTGSILAWGGRELVVFDMAEDEEDEEDDDDGGDMEE